ncbi:MFS transporter [Nucisporomicrobium flavum]|uniref:MFS transporter n=1 Tax=Nucisporomicrobium flavum TaxID=2785915 RepID=UPI003C2EA557
MGPDFRRLWAASAVANLGDGVAMAAGPLLVAAITADPAAVAGAAFAQQAPWLLFALISGAWADRLDRRLLVVTVDLIRAAALAILAASVATGTATIWLIYAVLFILGTCETLADTAAAAFVPALVPPSRLPTANSWLGGTFTVVGQFAAKPLGGWLFAIAAAAPFGLQAVAFAGAAVLVGGIRSLSRSTAPSDPAPSERPSMVLEIRAGLRWLWGHRLLRTLAVTMAFANLVYCAAFATFVLYAQDRLGLGSTGYGVLLTAFAVGGLAGTLIAPRLLRTLPAAVLLRAGLLIEVALHATLATTTAAPLAAAMIVVFGVHTMVWGNVVWTLRQRSVPSTLYGRVTSVYSFVDLGGAALGSLLGGVVANAYGIVPMFWTAAAAMTVIAVVGWRPLGVATAVFRAPVPG